MTIKGCIDKVEDEATRTGKRTTSRKRRIKKWARFAREAFGALLQEPLGNAETEKKIKSLVLRQD